MPRGAGRGGAQSESDLVDARQRLAAADRQGLRLRTLVGVARHRVTADLRRVGIPPEYPLEQYVRDAKIDSLYEGTTAIQGQDFFFRKIVRDRGEALGYLSNQVLATIKGGGSDDTLTVERELLATALTDFGSMVDFLVGKASAADPRAGGDASSAYAVGQHSTRLLLAAGDLLVGWLLIRQADVAQAALAGESAAGLSTADRDFYVGKVAGARFFAREVLPRLSSDAVIIKTGEGGLMDVPETAF